MCEGSKQGIWGPENACYLCTGARRGERGPGGGVWRGHAAGHRGDDVAATGADAEGQGEEEEQPARGHLGGNWKHWIFITTEKKTILKIQNLPTQFYILLDIKVNPTNCQCEYHLYI